MAAGDTVNLDGGYLADRLVEIDSTVAIADDIALEPVTAPKAEWQDYTAVDTEDVEDIQFALEAVAGTLLAIRAHDWDVVYTGFG